MNAEFRAAAARRELMAAADGYLRDDGPTVVAQFEHADGCVLRLLAVIAEAHQSRASGYRHGR